MKTIFRNALFLFVIFSSAHVFAQSVGRGRIDARFGVDADVSADTSLNGGAASAKRLSDDWFKSDSDVVKIDSGGIMVIDTTGAYGYKLIMQSSQAARNALFFKMPMAVPKLTRSGDVLLLDALYVKDYLDNDKTAITGPGGVKVIDDPSTWVITTGNINGKSDIMDIYTHVRRKGEYVHDSLFFYFGVGIQSTAGDKTVYAELFVRNVGLDTVAHRLTGTGSQGGRVAWRLDNSGDVIYIGDMTIQMTYHSGGAGSFEILPRIWTTKTLYDSFKPGNAFGLSTVHFDFSTFDQQSGGSPYGYAGIVPKVTTEIGQGVVNANNTLAAAPWGTIGSASGYPFQTHYDPKQFLEFSANLTAMGIDPAFFSGIDPCTIPYRSISFYSQTSGSLSSSPQDFAGPYAFWRYPATPAIALGTDTLNCVKKSGTILADSAYSLAYYKWTTLNGGNITGYNSDSTEITFDKPGKYVLQTSPLRGCFTNSDTITVLEDVLYPIATAEAYDTLIDGSVSAVSLYGGDVSASNAAVNSLVFGSSHGLSWYWTNKNGYVSDLQNPVVLDSGTYRLIVTELRNGCKDTAFTILVALPVTWGPFNCNKESSGTVLNWTTFMESGSVRFGVEQLVDGKFREIGSVPASGTSFGIKTYTFIDQEKREGNQIYRISMYNQNGMKESSHPCFGKHQDGNASYEPLLYPVPSENTVYISVLGDGIRAWMITDPTGRICGTGDACGALETNISLSQLSNGAYTITFVANGVQYNRLILKK